MIVNLKFRNEIIVMSALKEGDSFYILTPNDTKLAKYLNDDDQIIVETDSKELMRKARKVTDLKVVREYFDKFDEEGMNYFKQFSNNLILIICE